MKKNLFDKIWESHVVKQIDEKSVILYIDHQYIHEVTSPQAFEGISQRGASIFRPHQMTAVADHNIPTQDQHLPISNVESAKQIETLTQNCNTHNINYFPIGHPNNGIVHVVGPECGITKPGMTIVCGDSHTSTHGAFGAIAFGVGTSEVEMVMASQTIIQAKPMSMRICVKNRLNEGVSAKDFILYIISKIGTGGGTGYFIEFAGEAIENLSMEERMTVCNMSIEMGARGGMIAPDSTTFEYMQGREYAPKADKWDKAITEWSKLFTDEGASFDKEYEFDAKDITPMITFGTNPGMGISIVGTIPQIQDIAKEEQESFIQALNYMNFSEGQSIENHPIDYVFVGSCTNGRIEDLREFAQTIKGQKVAEGVTVWVVPGSKQVESVAKQEGIDTILRESGIEMRQPGCSACLAMNDDKVPAGKYCVSTSNRNFEGRQGAGSRTLLASPKTAAIAAITGKILSH